jgi:hypothetical protein
MLIRMSNYMLNKITRNIRGWLVCYQVLTAGQKHS